MILLLKDEYRVKGIKQLLSIGENGYIVKNQAAATTALAPPDELAHKVEVLSTVLQEMIQTGLFHLHQDNEAGTIRIAINQDYLVQHMKLLSTEQLSDIRIERKNYRRKQTLQKQITELKEENQKDIVVKIRERQIENEVVATLRTEALEQFTTQKKSRVFAKLFRSAQVELEKERFINQYLAKNLSDRLQNALTEYHETP